MVLDVFQVINYYFWWSLLKKTTTHISKETIWRTLYFTKKTQVLLICDCCISKADPKKIYCYATKEFFLFQNIQTETQTVILCYGILSLTRKGRKSQEKMKSSFKASLTEGWLSKHVLL